MDKPGEVSGDAVRKSPPWWRVVVVSAAVSAAVLWAWSGWDLWALAVLIGGLLVARLVVGLVPQAWRDWVSARAAVVVAVVVVGWLVGLVPWTGLGVAAGVGGLVAVWQLRKAVPPRPRWALVALSATLAAVCGVSAAWMWAADRERREAAERAEREYRVADMRPPTPLAVLHLMVKAVHENDPALVCHHMFTPDAGREFARAVDAQDCPGAIGALHDRITGKGYGNSTAPARDVTRESSGTPASVSGCDMYVVDGPLSYRDSPGPRLGVFRLGRDPRYPDTGYLVTGYTTCEQADQQDPTTSATPPPVLPSYPPSLAGIVARAIVTTDPGVCAYFTDQGAAQFAATVGVSTCREAIAALAQKVTDPTAYISPSGVTTSETGGRTVVHACALTWTRWGAGEVTAGPQLGHLTLSQPDPGSPGYLIDAVRAC